jgi:hypothetical protein
MTSNPDSHPKSSSQMVTEASQLQEHQGDALELEQKFKLEEEQEQSAQRGSDLPNRQITIANSPGAAVDADLSDRV